MASQITEGIVKIAWAPCPPEKLPALRYGINTLFDWLESLPDAPIEQEECKRFKVTIINTHETEPWMFSQGTQKTLPVENTQGTQKTLGG